MIFFYSFVPNYASQSSERQLRCGIEALQKISNKKTKRIFHHQVEVRSIPLPESVRGVRSGTWFVASTN